MTVDPIILHLYTAFPFQLSPPSVAQNGPAKLLVPITFKLKAKTAYLDRTTRLLSG